MKTKKNIGQISLIRAYIELTLTSNLIPDEHVIFLKRRISKCILLLNTRNKNFEFFMKIESHEIISVLSKFNPWWRSESISDLPTWKRSYHKEILNWLITPPTHRAIMLSGARQVGKTTLILQIIDDLINNHKVPPANILYVTFDHPILKLAGIDAVLAAWREREPQQSGTEFIFLDEAQFVQGWGTWIKHQVDFYKNRQIVFTGSAMPLMAADQESGLGRWHTIRITTLSFYEYIQIKKISLPSIENIESFDALFDWSSDQFMRISDSAAPYIGHFHEYLVRGGFPQTTLMETITQAQRLLREDIIDKALKRDMTALFGVRRVLDLEHTFLYLCMHDSGLLDMTALCANLSVKRPTAQHFIELLEATHLIYRLPPFGYGKDVLRGRYKIYLADAAIASAVMLRGKGVIDDPNALGVAAETAVFKHLYAKSYNQNVRLTHWKDKNNLEIDFVAEFENKIIPFEVKYRNQHWESKDLQGILNLCSERNIEKGYVITKSMDDFGISDNFQKTKCKLLRIPAALFCYWIEESSLVR